MILDTIVFIFIWSFLVLGFCSFVEMVDQILFDGVISDFFSDVFEKFIEICEWLIKKIARRK